MGNPISTNESVIGIAKGSTWGTAVDIATASGTGSGGAMHARVSLSTSRGEFRPNDVGFGNMIEEIEKLEESVSVTITADTSYHGRYLMALAGVLGTASAPSETTASQGDYLHNLDLATNNDSDFFTVAFISGEDNAVLELPSVKFHTFTWSHGVNGVGTFTATGIASGVTWEASTPENTAAELNSLTYDTYQACVLGGANHYFRINTVGGSTLSSSDDFEIKDFTVGIQRPLELEYCLRGANSKYTEEPKQTGDTTGTLTANFCKSERSRLDVMNIWSTGTQHKAEIFFDGDQIGTGVNTSCKFQFPKLEIGGAMPTGFDLPNSNQRMRPGVTWNLLKATSAPSGMTGVTNYMRAALINQRSDQYV